ncbi:MAG TPA: ATP-binding cassette domain-containing protein [Methanocorpusculum sp.]|nr:ATP-binding cassette domain-containing protein [Methanocorpusculum sp.]
MHLIETRNLCYTYSTSKTTTLNNINFIADAKQRIAVLGPNGAGKSTLFRHFNGILLPTSGEILINGEIVTKKNIPAVRRKIGVVFQNPDDQIFSSTVEQDIAFGPANLGLSKDEVEERVNEVIHMLGLEELRDRAPHLLSGGEKKRVAIAGVLAMQPEVIILDEPTAGLDPRGVSDLFRFLNMLPETLGCTIIYATHQVELVPENADLVYILEHGEITACGTPAEIFAQEDVLERAHLELPAIPRLIHSLQNAGVNVEDAYTYQEGEDAVLRAFGKEPYKHHEEQGEVHTHSHFHRHPHYHESE